MNVEPDPQPEAGPVDKEVIQRLVEQLYENERLTGNLTDEPAKILLKWGEQQIRDLAQTHSDQAELEKLAYQLQRVIRSINRLVGQKADLSETDMVERLLELVEQSKDLRGFPTERHVDR